MFFDSKKGRGSHEAPTGDVVPSVTVDAVLDGKKADFIKMDVEGNELKAISGGEDFISSNTPKMHIACYHTPFDIFEIPLKIEKLVPEYKIYMRHHPCFPAWDINYIFVR